MIIVTKRKWRYAQDGLVIELVMSAESYREKRMLSSDGQVYGNVDC